MISILRRFLTDEADIPLGQLTATLATELVERLKRVFSLEISSFITVVALFISLQ